MKDIFSHLQKEISPLRHNVSALLLPAEMIDGLSLLLFSWYVIVVNVSESQSWSKHLFWSVASERAAF